MKRNNEGVPVDMMQRWKRPPVSCQLCRAKKLRCDRSEPCSNCTTRGIECVYAGRTNRPSPEHRRTSSPQTPAHPETSPQTNHDDNPELLLARLRKLEEVVFNKARQASIDGSRVDAGIPGEGSASQPPIDAATSPPQVPISPPDEPPNLAALAKHLPPKDHALQLLQHLAASFQLTFGVFHIPPTQHLLEQTYQKLLQGEDVNPDDLFLLFCIFAGATFFLGPRLLQELEVSEERSKILFDRHLRLALSLLDNTATPLGPSTVTLEGIIILLHLLSSLDGYTEKVYIMRTRALLMARTMQIHRLDTAKNRELRRLHGYNPVEVELQRRIWWNIVSSDWLLSFSGGPQEGTYLLHPNHMKVNYPRNIDDDLIASTGESYDFPLSVPTSMTAFLCRVRLADVCRQVIDTLPTISLDPQEVDYDTVLTLDTKFRELLRDLPSFFQLDPISVQQNEQLCRERPYIPWHRIALHLGINTRICRLHRPFHLAISTNPRYAFSRTACIKAAQTVLELRRSMEELDRVGGLKPSRFWVIQHVFLAAITLATDVSLDPNASYASVRKAEVLAACRMLEKLQGESVMAKEAVQNSVRTLMSMIQKTCPLISTTKGKELPTVPETSCINATEGLPTLKPPVELDRVPDGTNMALQQSAPLAECPAMVRVGVPGENMSTDPAEPDWDQLWSDFFNASGDWDMPQWTSLMEGIDLNLGPSLSS